MRPPPRAARRRLPAALAAHALSPPLPRPAATPSAYHAHAAAALLSAPAREAALASLGSLLALALPAGGGIYLATRRAWAALEPWVTRRPGGGAAPAELHGVDVSGCAAFSRPAVAAAARFAARAHAGQARRSGEPYVAHCVETAKIVEALLPGGDPARAEAAVVAALLHDVMDDAGVDPADVEAEFGAEVAALVRKVSQLSTTNQLVRRRLRLAGAAPAPAELAQLRHMILTMVSEPRALVVKLADRLHNMRTVWALPPDKAAAVAEETRRVWCSLAERLGMFALKGELEDLCFAVLAPEEYRALRGELDAMWGVSSIPAAAAVPEECCLAGECECPADAAAAACAGGGGDAGGAAAAARRASGAAASTSAAAAAELLASVLPHDASTFTMRRLRIAPPALRGLEVLQGCARALLQEVATEGAAVGLDVSVQGRLKSLHSTFRKMARKGVPLSGVCDARALRVVVDDAGGTRAAEATAACYQLLPVVHRLWRRIEGEEDDYIARPKASGYQSLHTAVVGPGGAPMEVQIRTASMHEVAEYGRAAHWAYKERAPAAAAAAALAAAPAEAAEAPGAALEAAPLAGAAAAPAPAAPPALELAFDPEALARGAPLLHISPGGALRDAAVVRAEEGGRRLLVAVALGARRFPAAAPTRAADAEYAELLARVDAAGWFEAGQGDLGAALELFTLCSDGRYHRLDAFGRRLPTSVVPLPPEEGPESAALVGAEAEAAAALAARVQLLRSMLEWGRVDMSMPMPTGAPEEAAAPPPPRVGEPTEAELATERSPPDVMVILPSGQIARVRRGTTAGMLAARELAVAGAADAAAAAARGFGRREAAGGGGGRARGGRGGAPSAAMAEAALVNVNGALVPGDTLLADGDYVG